MIFLIVVFVCIKIMLYKTYFIKNIFSKKQKNCVIENSKCLEKDLAILKIEITIL